MVCVYCSSKTSIINSRHLNRTNATWRRRKCINCATVFTSIERPDLSSLWVVKDTNRGKITAFDEDKLYLSIFNSLGHRKAPVADSRELLQTILKKLLKVVNEGSLTQEDLMKSVFIVLDSFDKFAGSYYKKYNGIN